MKRIAFPAVAVAVVAGAAAWAQQAGKKDLAYAPASAAAFKEVMPGASQSVVWGDPATGPHGSFTKFVPGFDAGVHTHTSDLRIVVIKGAYLYKADGKDIRVGPGDTLFIPGGNKHWSGGDAKEGALFYTEGAGKFDVNPVK
jgi:quercetin dioxygenase-like cupin family protein